MDIESTDKFYLDDDVILREAETSDGKLELSVVLTDAPANLGRVLRSREISRSEAIKVFEEEYGKSPEEAESLLSNKSFIENNEKLQTEKERARASAQAMANGLRKQFGNQSKVRPQKNKTQNQ
jgi:hypothetical protein